MFVLSNTTSIANIYPGDILDSAEGLTEVPSRVTEFNYSNGIVTVGFENGATRQIRATANVKVFIEV